MPYGCFHKLGVHLWVSFQEEPYFLRIHISMAPVSIVLTLASMEPSQSRKEQQQTDCRTPPGGVGWENDPGIDPATYMAVPRSSVPECQFGHVGRLGKQARFTTSNPSDYPLRRPRR